MKSINIYLYWSVRKETVKAPSSTRAAAALPAAAAAPATPAAAAAAAAAITLVMQVPVRKIQWCYKMRMTTCSSTLLR